MAGLTDDGLEIKTLQEIRTELRASLRSALGSSINVAEDSVLGNFIDILSEQIALEWEALEDIYNAFYPDTANGTSLDNVVALTGIQRLDPTFSTATVTAFGTATTVIPAGSRIAVDGNPDIIFETDEEYTIASGTDEVQDITFSAVPASGDFTLVYDGDETNAIDYTDTNTTVQTELNSLAGLSSVTVTGDFTSGFTVTFTGSDGEQDQEALTVGTNTLQDSGPADVDITITETTKGVLAQIDMECTSDTAGAIEAAAGTITQILDTVSGWDTASNALDAETGTDTETDAALRLRRLQTLASPGLATQDAIRARVLELDDVEACVVYSNRTNSTDSDGRPAKSFEVVVLGGTDDDIADKIWDSQPVGIESHGSTTVTITDSQGFEHDINFSRPTEIDIYIEVDIEINEDDYPSGGDDSIKDEIIDFADENFTIGDDVITTKLYEAVHNVDGVTEIDFRISTANTALVQVLEFDADFVTSNAIDGKIAGTDITQVPFNSDHATTIGDLATEIQSNALITTAVADAAERTVTVTSLTAGSPGVLSDFEVTGGASQPTAIIYTTSHTDGNVTIAADEISNWDTSRIIVTQI